MPNCRWMLALLMLCLLGGCETDGSAQPFDLANLFEPAAPQGPPPPRSARFQAEVYQVQMPAGAAMPDRSRLSALAADPQAFADAVGGYGASKLVYFVDQSISLMEANRISTSAQLPVERLGRGEQQEVTIRSVDYRDSAALFEVGPSHGGISTRLEISYVTAGAQAPSVSNVRIADHAAAEFGTARVLLSVDALDGRGSGPIAWICRTLISDPQR